jgi:hypothetical protein
MFYNFFLPNYNLITFAKKIRKNRLIIFTDKFKYSQQIDIIIVPHSLSLIICRQKTYND